MIFYYLRLAAISLRRNWGQTTLMILAIGLGIGVCMSIVTINYLMAKDPIPDKSSQLYYVQLDNWDPNRPAESPNEPPDQITWMDHQALMSAAKAFRQTGNASATAIIRKPDDDNFRPFLARIRGNHADFFPMFDVPFLYGTGWTSDAHRDWGADQVVVLSRETNDRLFGGEDSVGREITLGNPTEFSSNLFRVIGVLDEWRPVPRFYDLTSNYFSDPAEIFIPFGLILSQGLSRSGNTNCWKPTGDGLRAFLGSECVWIQYWAELRNHQEKADYMAYLDQYVTEQKEGGRFPRPLNNRLSNVNEWLDHENVVQPEAKMLLAVAVMFLVVCLLNTIGLLLSKFLGKSSEIGVRRALGASRGSLMYQYLVETAMIGFGGGLLGLLLTWLGLESMLAIFGSDASNLMRLDLNMVVAAVALAIASAIGAGLYPTWRACRIDPAAQLKSQ